MKNLNKIIQLFAIGINGVFIGAMLLIAVVFVPFWRALEPQAFLDWFSVYGSRIGALMIPLGPGVLILTVIALLLNKKKKERLFWMLAIVFTLVNILYFPVYFLPTNTSFAEQTISIGTVSSELNHWLTYHVQRIIFAFGALVASVIAVLTQEN